MTISYTARRLLQLRERTVKSMMRITKTVYNDLKQLGICYVTPTHRGTTGGLRSQHWQPKTVESNSVTLGVPNLQRCIPTIIGNRPTAQPAERVGTSPPLHDNLIPVKLSSNPRTYLSKQVSLYLTHFIPSPQPTRATVLPGCLPILASQKPAKIGSSPITVFLLPLLCDFSISFTKTYCNCYHIYIKGKLTK